jgi:hypothetical protein
MIAMNGPWRLVVPLNRLLLATAVYGQLSVQARR